MTLNKHLTSNGLNWFRIKSDTNHWWTFYFYYIIKLFPYCHIFYANFNIRQDLQSCVLKYCSKLSKRLLKVYHIWISVNTIHPHSSVSLLCPDLKISFTEGLIWKWDSHGLGMWGDQKTLNYHSIPFLYLNKKVSLFFSCNVTLSKF